MQVIILAGGLGTRLYPVIKDVPKPMAPVGNKCFLEIILDLMKKYGLTDFIFCVSHMAEKMVNYFGDGSRFGVKISYSTEEVPLGTGGAIGLLRNVINDTFCVLNGDTYQELDLEQCLARHKASGAIGTMTLVEVRDTSRYGQAITDHGGYLTGFREKSTGVQETFINAGLYILEPTVFDYIPPEKFVSLENDVLPAILEDDKKISTYKYGKNFFDIGIPEDYYNFLRWVTGD
ncbi:MAG: nucleotidyltransferase family protein [Desulfitobacteriaceae bacterium]